jgi:hypothetical protein
MSEHKLRVHKKSGIIYCFLCDRTVRLDKVSNHFGQLGFRKHNLPSAGDARDSFNSSLIQRLEQAGAKSYEDVLAFVFSGEPVDPISGLPHTILECNSLLKLIKYIRFSKYLFVHCISRSQKNEVNIAFFFVDERSIMDKSFTFIIDFCKHTLIIIKISNLYLISKRSLVLLFIDYDKDLKKRIKLRYIKKWMFIAPKREVERSPWRYSLP